MSDLSDSTQVSDAPAGASAQEAYAYTPRWLLIVLILAFALIAYLLYSEFAQQRRAAVIAQQMAAAQKQAAALSNELDRTNSALADLRSDLQMTEQKLGLTQDELARARSLAQRTQKEQQLSSARLRRQIGQVQQQTSTQLNAVSSELQGTKGDIAAAQKDIQDAKMKLGTAVGDLGVQSGLIARNHEEVQELKHLTDRNIYEFTLNKSKSPARVGPIELQLTKVNTKHYTYTMDVIADDRRIQKKPVQFYVEGARVPYEVVVYSMSKDRVTGYLSTPK